jgi:tetratricopeptide (TPR) repeat protein
MLLASVPQARATAEPQKVRAEKYEIEVRFEPEKSFLHAKATVSLRAEQKTETVELELNSRLSILEVSDAQGRKLEFRRSGRLGSSKLQVWLAEAAAAEQEIKLTFEYEGTLLRGALDYITKDGILLRDESRWYPAVDLSAFTQNDIVVTLPARWDVVSSGEEINSTDAKGVRRWRTKAPVSSRSLVGAPERAWRCQTSAAMTTHFNIGPMRTDTNLRFGTAGCMEKLKATPDLLIKSQYVLSALSIITGDFRRRAYSIVQGFPGQQGAIGYSASGFLVVSEDIIKYHGYPGWAPEFLPHEIAHQWFPIEVTLALPEDGWLAESLAEYLAWRYLLEKEPEQARRMVQRAMRDALAPEPPRPLALGLQLFREPWNVAHSTLYQRGLLVWRTLETVIDRERVDLALREYYKRYAGRSASIADFRKVCEEISGRDLAWFFEYFINGTQIPEISLRRLPSDAPNVLAGEIMVKNVPPEFQVRVEMRVQTSTGPVDHSVATRGEVTPFSLNLAAPATQVTLDPDMRLLRWTEAARRNREQAKLLGQVSELEEGGEFSQAIEVCRQALALDPDDVAANQQQIRFVMGRMLYRAGKLAEAKREFGSALEQTSWDTMNTDFYRAWAHVYRARIAKRLGQIATAQKEAKAGLASNSPAMETKIVWAETPSRELSAREALREFVRAPK